jgi:hypothetical protein
MQTKAILPPFVDERVRRRPKYRGRPANQLKKVIATPCPENRLPNMGRSTGFIGLVIVVAIVGYLYTAS